MLALQIILGFATALVFTLLATPLVYKIATTYGLYDVPDIMLQGQTDAPRRIHKSPVPRLGGIAMVAGFFLANLVWSSGSDLYGPLAASVLIFLVGLLDDLRPISPRIRLGCQIVCAAYAVMSGGLAIKAIALTPDIFLILPEVVGFAISVFIVVGAINAINMIDGLDGLAGGVVLIGVALLSYIYFIRTLDVHLLLYLSVPMVGAILGFLRYNTYPASIFMGDGGSNWLGFMSGIFILVVLGNFRLVEPSSGSDLLDVTGSIRGARFVPIVSAVLCLAVPIIDTACVMVSRMRKGLSPMHADRRHFHHALLRLGLSHSQSVTAVYFITLLSGVLGIIPIAFPRYGLSWIPFLTLAGLLFFIPIGINGSSEVLDFFLRRRSVIRTDQRFSRGLNVTIRYWENFNRYIIYTIFMVSPMFAGVFKPEIGYAAAVVAVLLLFSLVISRGRGDFMDSLILSIGALILLVANNQNSMMIEIMGQRLSIQGLYNGLFITLFVSTAILLIVTAKARYFLFTPSDFLLVTLPMILLLVPEPFRSQYRLDIICLRSLIVFMALRSIMKRRHLATYHIRLVTVVALMYVVMTSVFAMRVIYH